MPNYPRGANDLRDGGNGPIEPASGVVAAGSSQTPQPEATMRGSALRRVNEKPKPVGMQIGSDVPANSLDVGRTDLGDQRPQGSPKSSANGLQAAVHWNPR
jgi:hypothetical protein